MTKKQIETIKERLVTLGIGTIAIIIVLSSINLINFYLHNKEMKEGIIEFEINSCSDKDLLVTVLANNGYKVWVEEKTDPEWRWNKIYCVYVELKTKKR